jgi:hypothetical protein
MALRRPAQKGLSRFRFGSEEEELRAARVSVRRWWWEYLRLSKDYWLVSQTHGRTLDRALYEIWRRFGDVHTVTFDEWWLKTGSSLFREQTDPPKVTLIQSDLSNMKTPNDSRILIEVPLILRKATVQRQIGKLLASLDFERPRNVLETSTSDFRINPVAFRLNVLQKMHEVWCAHREEIVKPKLYKDSVEGREHQRSDLFELGKKLDLSPANGLQHPDYDEDKKRKNRMRATVSRYIRRADQLIYQVEYGQFPMFKSPPAKIPPRFTDKQLAAHIELEQQWWAMDLTARLES